MGTWTPKVCKIMAFMAIILGLGLLFYILSGFRYGIKRTFRQIENQNDPPQLKFN